MISMGYLENDSFEITGKNLFYENKLLTNEIIVSSCSAEL